jgi:nucleoside-diphosphate-sugar epimerase
VGKRVAEQFVMNDYDVTVLNRSGVGPEKCSVIKHDRNQPFELPQEYDFILDFCLFKKEQAELLVKSLKKDQRYIFISSGAVYKDSHCLTYTEESPIGGRTAFGAYGVEKSECEAVIKSSKLNYVILRPPYILGTHDTVRPRLSYYVNQLIQGKEVDVAGQGDKILSFVWADDMIGFISDIVLFDLIHREAVNIAGDDWYSSRSLIQELASYLNFEPRIRENGKDAPFINEHLMLVTSNTLWKAFSPIKGHLPNFMKWYNEQNYQSQTVYSSRG